MASNSPSHRDDAIDLASIAVDEAARDGGIVPVRETAQAIFRQVPDRSMSLEELEKQITRMATARGVAVQLG